ncbi:MAG: carbon-nitrogen hydrolase family protein [Hyphomicrobiaceae bacterium]|nr:carbon-nitrogen hydrolase family protein [Hyphomicrobiaceae bacterium]
MKIALLQTAPKKDAPGRNLEDALNGLREASARGAQLVVLPECAISGYAISSRDDAFRLAETIPGPSTAEVHRHAAATGCHVVSGLLERDGDRLFNTAVIVGPHGVIGRHRKAHIVPVGADAFVARGDDLAVHDVLGVKIGLMICYEVRFPEIARVLALKGAQVIVVAANWPAGADVNPVVMVPARAAENSVHVLAANRTGQEGELSFIGRSCAYAPNGSCIVSAQQEEKVLFADIEIGHGLGKREVRDSNYVVDLRGHRRPELYQEIGKP